MDERWCRVLLLVGALAVAGCPRDRDSSNGVPSSQPSSTTPFASNAGDVTRYDDEIPLGPDATIAKDKTPARRAPGTGAVVATLPTGTEVTKLSTRGNDTLIVFDDPKESTGRLMGWVPESSLDESAPPSTPPSAPLPPLSGEAGPSADDGGSPSTPPDPDPSRPGHHHHHPRPRPHQ
jgi:hypothetical protein